MQTASSSLISEFSAAVWRNYEAAGRRFPWRETDDPYAVMVSEFMLQQTQTNRVVAKYEAWLSRFPDVQSAADAPLSEVLSLWNGLGYNRRAKFLHESCRKICADYGGVLPCDAELLDALPGIGPYTARAVAAFAFNKAEAFIETNIRSAFIYFFFPGAASVSDAEILPLVEQTLDRERPREWYYALMDYGAAVKRRTENPSRRSASYARQSKFEGSLRQARGAILRQLSKNGSAALADIAAAEHIDMERLASAAQRLAEERLVRESGGRYSFC
ncbi:MAG: A/G-specific adenine glycosylase [Treponemataceae bacterium]|nr:A/G-specific adenine glycosylase [Treponemataceae bacterium]